MYKHVAKAGSKVIFVSGIVKLKTSVAAILELWKLNSFWMFDVLLILKVKKLNSSYKRTKINNCLIKKVKKLDTLKNSFLYEKCKTKQDNNIIIWRISINWYSRFSPNKTSGKKFDNKYNNGSNKIVNIL